MLVEKIYDENTFATILPLHYSTRQSRCRNTLICLQYNLTWMLFPQVLDSILKNKNGSAYIPPHSDDDHVSLLAVHEIDVLYIYYFNLSSL